MCHTFYHGGNQGPVVSLNDFMFWRLMVLSIAILLTDILSVEEKQWEIAHIVKHFQTASGDMVCCVVVTKPLIDGYDGRYYSSISA